MVIRVGGGSMTSAFIYGGFTPLWLVQSYWVVWLLVSFLVSFTLGAVILRNWEVVK